MASPPRPGVTKISPRRASMRELLTVSVLGRRLDDWFIVSHSRAIGLGPESAIGAEAGVATAARELAVAPGADRIVKVRAVAPEFGANFNEPIGSAFQCSSAPRSASGVFAVGSQMR